MVNAFTLETHLPLPGGEPEPLPNLNIRYPCTEGPRAGQGIIVAASVTCLPLPGGHYDMRNGQAKWVPSC